MHLCRAGRTDRLADKITETPLDGLTDEQLDAYLEEAHGRIIERTAKGDPEAIEQARKLGLLPT